MEACSFFPSGRSVVQARNDAKRLARAEGVPLHEALDKTARANGLDMTWANAQALLSRHQYLANVLHESHFSNVDFGDFITQYSDSEVWESLGISIRFGNALAITNLYGVVRAFRGEAHAEMHGFYDIDRGRGGICHRDARVQERAFEEYWCWVPFGFWYFRDRSGFFTMGESEWYDICTPEHPLGLDTIAKGVDEQEIICQLEFVLQPLGVSARNSTPHHLKQT